MIRRPPRYTRTDTLVAYTTRFRAYADRVNEMSGGRLRLDLLAAGAVVGALQMQDAVIAGALDGGHGVTAYWYGKNKAYSLFGTSPPWGWNANQMLGWIKYGGGQQPYEELVQNVLVLALLGFLTGVRKMDGEGKVVSGRV